MYTVSLSLKTLIKQMNQMKKNTTDGVKQDVNEIDIQIHQPQSVSLAAG